MLFQIQHTTSYRYTAPVFCEPLALRLQPRTDGAQRLLRYRLVIEPRPAGVCTTLEPDGSVSHRAWFDDTCTELIVFAQSVVETLRENPFDYLLEPRALQLQALYTPAEREILAAYLQPLCIAPAVAKLGEEMARRVDRETQLFLLGLAGWIYDAIEPVVRLEGPAYLAAETLSRRQGACRDTAMLFVDVCRHVGLAARFVSGYQQGDPDENDRHLHAWAEVYLPGAGWRGFDPSHGLAVSNGHVALATGIRPEQAMPLTGTFRGNGVRAALENKLSIRIRKGAVPDPGQGFSDASGECESLFASSMGALRQSMATIPR